MDLVWIPDHWELDIRWYVTTTQDSLIIYTSIDQDLGADTECVKDDFCMSTRVCIFPPFQIVSHFNFLGELKYFKFDQIYTIESYIYDTK